MHTSWKRSLSIFLIPLSLLAAGLWPDTVSAAQPSLNLTWSDNSTNEDGFKIERKLDLDGTFGQIATVGANITSYVDSDSNLAPGTRYCYRVRAYNTAGNSAYTNEDCGETEEEHFLLTVTQSGDGEGTVSSNPNGIDCGTDCAEEYPRDTLVTLTATPDAGSTFAGWSDDADCVDGTVSMTTTTTCTASFQKIAVLNVDTDGDGLRDSDEVNLYGTDPENPDTDGDGFSDGTEINAGSHPVDAVSTPPAGGPLDPVKCYTAFTASGTPKLEPFEVLLDDAFESKHTTVVRPASVCTPVAIDGHPLLDPPPPLTCYTISDVFGQAKFAPQTLVSDTPFGTETLTVAKANTLCVPSQLTSLD